MRRIAAVFASKRSDRSDAASTSAVSATTVQSQPTVKQSSKRFFRSLSKKSKPVDPVLNRLSSTDHHPPSSSSSSSGAPTTPDDDRGSILRAPPHKAWLTLPHPVDSTLRLGSFHHLEPPLSHDLSRSPAALRPTASPSTLDTEDEESEESYLPRPTSIPERATPLSAPAYLLALTSSNRRLPYAPPPLLHVPGCPVFPRSSNPSRTLPYADSLQTAMHRRKLESRLQRADLSPSETRSIAPFAGRRNPIKARLSLQLDDCAIRQGRVFAHSAGLKSWADRPCFEDRLRVLLAENVPPASNGEPVWTRVEPATAYGVAALEYSMALELLAGLYEDELPRDFERLSPVPDAPASSYLRLDTHLALDLGSSFSPSPTLLSPSSSVSLPLPATMVSPPLSSTTASAPTPSPKPPQPPTISQSQSRGQSYKASPSPLRMEAVSLPLSSTSKGGLLSPPSSAATVSSPLNAPSVLASPPASASSAQPSLKPALKQGVRFAEEEKEDQIPLSYVMRIKQKREEKARFLQAERERRKHEDERRKHEEEKRKWEEERAAWDREKRAMEEDRKKRALADEVAAARSRRESQRFGITTVSNEALATGHWDRGERPRPEREGSSSSSYSRPVYDPATGYTQPPMPRQHSDSSLVPPKPSRQGSASGSGSGSPADSRPNSVYGAGSVNGNGSRPPSNVPTPASSQQDVRNRERERERERRMSGSGSRRGSMVSESGGSSWRRSQTQIPPLPLPSPWMGMNMNMNSPPMPMVGMPMPMSMPMAVPTMQAMPMPMQMPMYGMGMDMPLLPPSPPFMMQQYGPRSPGGTSSNTKHHSSQQRSQSSSPTLGRQNLPASGSSERVNRMSMSMSHSQQARGSSPSARAPSVPRSETTTPHSSGSSGQRARHQRTSSGDVPRPHHQQQQQQRPANPRSHTVSDDRRSSRGPNSPHPSPLTDDRRSSRGPSSPHPHSQSHTQTQPPRPSPTHSSSLPPHPPPVFSQARSSWALPQSGFENVSRPPNPGRRQTSVIS